MAKDEKQENTENSEEQNKSWLSSPLKALSDPTRLKILLMLEGKPRTVGEIVEFFDLSQPTITRHLQALSHAGLARRTQSGRKVLYQINTEKVGIMCLELTKCFPCCCESVQVQMQPFALGSCCEETPQPKAETEKSTKKTIKKKATKKTEKKTTGRAARKSAVKK
jgi:DNA-binding transcriptional ArsR family regulator